MVEEIADDIRIVLLMQLCDSNSCRYSTGRGSGKSNW